MGLMAGTAFSWSNPDDWLQPMLDEGFALLHEMTAISLNPKRIVAHADLLSCLVSEAS